MLFCLFQVINLISKIITTFFCRLDQWALSRWKRLWTSTWRTHWTSEHTRETLVLCASLDWPRGPEIITWFPCWLLTPPEIIFPHYCQFNSHSIQFNSHSIQFNSHSIQFNSLSPVICESLRSTFTFMIVSWTPKLQQTPGISIDTFKLNFTSKDPLDYYSSLLCVVTKRIFCIPKVFEDEIPLWQEIPSLPLAIIQLFQNYTSV